MNFTPTTTQSGSAITAEHLAWGSKIGAANLAGDSPTYHPLTYADYSGTVKPTDFSYDVGSGGYGLGGSSIALNKLAIYGKLYVGDEITAAVTTGSAALLLTDNSHDALTVTVSDTTGTTLSNNHYGGTVALFLNSANWGVSAMGTASARLLKAVDASGTIALATVTSHRVVGRGTTGDGADEELVLSSGAGLTYAWAASSLSIGQTTDTPQFARIGIGAAADANIPIYAAGNNYVSAALGSVLPIYLQYYDPIIGFNMVSGKFGLGSSSNYAGRIGVAAATTGTMYFDVATAAGNAGAAASTITALSLDKNGNAEVYGNLKANSIDITPVAQTDWSSSNNPQGFSTVSSNECKYLKRGKLIFLWFAINGDSNATKFTFTLPAAPKNSGITNPTGHFSAFDNGNPLTTPGEIILTAGSTTASLYKDCALGAWTNANLKQARGCIIYES